MEDIEDMAVMKDCLMRALGLPTIYSDASVTLLLAEVKKLMEDEVPGSVEYEVLFAYTNFLRMQYT